MALNMTATITDQLGHFFKTPFDKMCFLDNVYDAITYLLDEDKVKHDLVLLEIDKAYVAEHVLLIDFEMPTRGLSIYADYWDKFSQQVIKAVNEYVVQSTVTEISKPTLWYEGRKIKLRVVVTTEKLNKQESEDKHISEVLSEMEI